MPAADRPAVVTVVMTQSTSDPDRCSDSRSEPRRRTLTQFRFHISSPRPYRLALWPRTPLLPVDGLAFHRVGWRSCSLWWVPQAWVLPGLAINEEDRPSFGDELDVCAPHHGLKVVGVRAEGEDVVSRGSHGLGLSTRKMQMTPTRWQASGPTLFISTSEIEVRRFPGRGAKRSSPRWWNRGRAAPPRVGY